MRSRLRTASRAMQLGMLAVAVAGVVTGNTAWVPAALISLFVSGIPSILKRDLRIVLPAELNFWIVLALFLHVIGGYSGFYENVPGWDHVTHAMSATLIAALGFVVVVSVDKYVESIYFPGRFLAFFIIMFTVAVGVMWEVSEYINDLATGSRLQYSLNDTMMDLLFDTLGGFVVAAAGVHYLTRTGPDRFVESMGFGNARARIKEIVRSRSGGSSGASPPPS